MTLKSLIAKDSILIVEQNPRELTDAINLCCETLVKANKVSTEYPAAIIRSHAELGAYYVLAPRIAMPHARPEDGVNELCLQLTVFKNGMDFGSEENGDVFVAITLAAIDGDSHIQTIMLLAELFQNDDDIDAIINATSPAEVYEIISKY